MRRPLPAGTVLEVAGAMLEKLRALERAALEGGSMAVVALAAELAVECMEVARSTMEVVLDQAARAEPSVAKCSCGQIASSKGFEGTSFTGRFGLVEVSRRRMECARCRTSWFPLDEAWKLPTGNYSDDVREATERLSCRLGSYAEAVAELRYLWGVAPEASTAKRWVGQDGVRANAMLDGAAQAWWNHYEGLVMTPVRTEGFGVVEVDGVHALTWKPGLEPRRKPSPTATIDGTAGSDGGVSNTSSERASRHQAPSTLSDVVGSPMGPRGRSARVHGREICMGITYLDEHACQQSPDRGVLLERRYVATLNDREGFWLKLHAAVAEQGVLERETLLRVSDAGAYFIEQTTELFCDQPLVGIIDIQHANQHVWEAGHKITGDSRKTAAWVLPHIQALWDGQVDQVIERLAAERERYQSDAARKAVDELTGYLTRNRHMMDYPRYRQAGYPIASAAIESANKRIVTRRCKQGGMIWSEPGIEAMLALRVAFYNRDTWETLWPGIDVRRAAA